MPRVRRKSAKTLRKERQQRQCQLNKSNDTAGLQTAELVDTDPEFISDVLITEGHVRNWILHGTFHQGDASLGASAGVQCTCTSLVFMLETSIRPNIQIWTSKDLDEIVRRGTLIYSRIRNKTGDYLFIDELPTSISYHNDTFSLATHQPFGGTIGRQNTEEPFYSILDALEETFRAASQAFLTIRGYTSGTIRSPLQNQGFFLFDSHSRDCSGYQCADGTSVCMQLMTIQEIAQYIGQLALSMNDVEPQTAFEITPADVLMEQTQLSIHTHISEQPMPNISTVHDKTIAMGLPDPQRTDGASCSHWSDRAGRSQSEEKTVAPAPSMHNETATDQPSCSQSARDVKRAWDKNQYWSNEVFRKKKIEANRKSRRLRIQTNSDYAETIREQARLRIQTKPDCAEINRERACL